MCLWRSRRAPIFEGQWTCSPDCLRAHVAAAVERESQSGPGGERSHRLPVGLILLEQGSITEEQLRAALAGQQRRAAETGEAIRLGRWLLDSGLLSETALTRALSAQWSCPILSLEGSRSAEMGTALPRLFAEALGALPVRAAGRRLLTLAFSGRIDRSLAYAVERMSRMRVVAGIARESEFLREQTRFFAAPAPATRCLEAESLRALSGAIAAGLEREKPVEARLARVHDFWWLRLWRRIPGEEGLPASNDVEDQIWSVGRAG